MKKILSLVLVLTGMVFTASASTVIHLLPGAWDKNNATERYAMALIWNDGLEQTKWVEFAAGDFNSYDATIDDEHAYTKMILCRMDGNASENKWDNRWNQTSDITNIPTNETWYEINTCEGYKDEYSTSTAPKTIYIQEKGTGAEAPELYCWKDSYNYNGDYPGYTLKSKTVDQENWYGFITISGSSCIISNNGDSDKTENITLPSSDVFYFYYPDTKSYATTESKFVSGTTKYATFGSTNKIYFGFLPTNVTASLLKVDNGALTSTQFTGDLIAGEGVLLTNDTGADITLHLPIATGDASSNSANQLVAVTSAQKLDQTSSGYTNYILTNQKANGTTGDVKFYKVNNAGSYVNEGTAYLKVPDGAGLAREFIWFDDVTGIDAAKVAKSGSNTYFNLAGQRTTQPAKGLYIVNGKKYIAK